MSARENILGRLNAAPKLAAIEPIIDSVMAVPSEVLIAEFLNHAKSQHTEIIDLRKCSIIDTLSQLCTRKNIKSIMLSEHDFPELNTWDSGPKIRRFNQPIELLKNELFDVIEAGITIADGAIADTGTLIHSDSVRTPRTLSLVPPIHICVLDVTQIYSNMQAALSSFQKSDIFPTNLIFITGPSKTSDIQQTLAYGAHGPRELILLLKDER